MAFKEGQIDVVDHFKTFSINLNAQQSTYKWNDSF